MNRFNYQTKSLIATSLIAFILYIVTSCFAWWNSQLDKRIAIVQNDLELTNEELAEAEYFKEFAPQRHLFEKYNIRSVKINS